MKPDAETTWSTSLVTASAFIGMLVAVIFGLLASLSGSSVAIDDYVLGTICSGTFVAHLRA